MKKIVIGLIALTAAIGGIFVFTRSASVPVADGKLVVAASIFPLADIAAQVGGDQVRVVTILPPGVSEHTYEPTPEAIRKAHGAQVFFKVGHGLDNWTDQIAKSVNEKALITDVSSGIPLREYEAHDEHDETEVGGKDPHYFLQLENGARIAQTIAQTLSSVDPEHRAMYEANAREYGDELMAADKALRAKMSTLTNKKIATFHEAWFYFADHYGLTIAATLEPFPGREPTPAYLKEFSDTVKSEQVTAVFAEPQFSSSALVQVARDLNITIGTLDPIGGTSAETSSYLKTIEYNAETVYNTLTK